MQQSIKLSSLLKNLGGMLETDREIIINVEQDKTIDLEGIKKHLSDNNIYPLALFDTQELVETFKDHQEKEDFYKYLDLEDLKRYLAEEGSHWYLNDDTDELFSDMVDGELSISTVRSKAVSIFIQENYGELVDKMGTMEEYISYGLGADSEDGVSIKRALELQRHLSQLITEAYEKQI